MKTAPIAPARIVFSADAPPCAAEHGGAYHPPVGALAQARHVFLRGNQLPQRWAGRADFTVLEIGFGLGNNFLSTWQAWRSDPLRCTRLHIVSLELHPPTRDDLARAHAAATPELRPLADALIAAWPALTPNLHVMDVDGGGVQLLLALGDAAQLLPALQLEADAFYLDGFAPALGPQLWQPRVLKALARKAARCATLATWCATGELRHGLHSAGFAVQRAAGIGGKWENTLATYAPAFEPRRRGAVPTDDVATTGAPPDRRGAAGIRLPDGQGDAMVPIPDAYRAVAVPSPGAQRTLATPFADAPRTTVVPRHDIPRTPAAAAGRSVDAVVIGAGIAGAAAAQALALQGLAVTVFDRHPEPAQETSGNPAGLFHGSVHAGDGSYARLYRAAALHAERVYAQAVRDGVPGATCGLLRLAAPHEDQAALQAVIDRLGLPPDYVSALAAGAASALAGVPLPAAAWFYPGGGWIAPAAWVRHALATPGVSFRGGCTIDGLRREADRWLLQDAHGVPVAESPIVVLAQAASAATLLAPLGHARWPLHHSRGQVTFWNAADAGRRTPLRMPVAGDGYAIALPGGGLLCGATHDVESPPGRHHAGADADACATRRAHAEARQHDHRHNIDRLLRLTGIAAPPDSSSWQGRTGWRLHADDRMPIAGALPLALMPAGQRLDQARLLPRDAGLFAITALGSRGLTLAPLLARLVAAQATGAPWPLEQDLADAIDPGRWLVRAARADSGAAGRAGRASSTAAGAPG